MLCLNYEINYRKFSHFRFANELNALISARVCDKTKLIIKQIMETTRLYIQIER